MAALTFERRMVLSDENLREWVMQILVFLKHKNHHSWLESVIFLSVMTVLLFISMVDTEVGNSVINF